MVLPRGILCLAEREAAIAAYALDCTHFLDGLLESDRGTCKQLKRCDTVMPERTVLAVAGNPGYCTFGFPGQYGKMLDDMFVYSCKDAMSIEDGWATRGAYYFQTKSLLRQNTGTRRSVK